MVGILYFALFSFCGVIIAHCLLPRKQVLVRIWLGLCAGLVLQMWLPALCAFLCDFSLEAHLLATVPLLAVTFAAYFLRDKSEPVPFDDRDRGMILPLLAVVLPLTVLGGYLQCTHVLNPVNGTYHTGQCTYGDLPLHLAITSGMRNASFPADYSILPGELLTYPFLTDTLSTGFMLMGWSLRSAVVIPGIYMMALTFAGYLFLARRMADTRRGAVLATLFFFINGGLGFFYLVDMQGRTAGYVGYNELQSVRGLWERIRLVLEGWYQTPANHAEFDTYNLRWSNVIADMMVPQRTTLGGWTIVIPCIYLLFDAVRPEEKQGIVLDKDADGLSARYVKHAVPVRQLVLLGAMAGALPMINTHCFLALGLLSAGWMLWDLIAWRRQPGRAAAFWALYGGIAVLLALPQLLTWTFHQAVGNSGFLKFHFNWVNEGKDGYFWFYIKNIGLPFILILLALLEKNQKRRFMACGAFVIYLIAEFIVFQPNTYDNNKLFYIWYMVCAVIAADYAVELLDKLKGMRARTAAAILCGILCFSTGALSVARECVSDYQMFSSSEIGAAEYIEEKTPEHAVFLTGTQHINFVSSLAGRTIVCGPDTWLVYHGFDNWDRQEDIRRFYADPYWNMDVLTEYDVDYIVLSSWEWSDMSVDWNALEELFERVYTSDDRQIAIYRVPKG